MIRVHVASDFNAELASRYLAANSAEPKCEVETAPFGQVFQSLGGFRGDGEAVLFVWTRPEGISQDWARHLAGEQVAVEQLLADVDQFVAALEHAAQSARLLLVASWVRTRVGRGSGTLEWSMDGGAALLARMNLRLAEGLAKIKGAYMLDAQRWIDDSRPARDSKFWYSIKSPFSEQVFKSAALDVKAAIRAATGKARKLLILDLDNTTWGGVVGDDGWENLRLGGHDAVGEAHVDLQRAALELSKRGVALGVVSKNDEAVALAAIDSHPEMVIRRSDLAGWRINWQDKAANIVALVEELNLGIDSVVFLDDNPTERGRIREALPQVLVPELPKNPATYADILRSLDCFDQASLTAEDRARTEMYVAERTRRESAASFSSADDWLKSLEIEVSVAPLGRENFKRVVQLINKTNQLNLTTRRLTDAELEAWLDGGELRGLKAITVADRFGDLGLTGIVSWQEEGDALEIVDFILSCRAMGREVERTMAHLAVEAARDAGKSRVIARYLPTARNRPTLEFWQNSGFEEVEPNLFVRAVADSYPRPEPVTLSLAA